MKQTMDQTPVKVPRVERLVKEPIIFPHMDLRMGDNINGPSLIRVPDWIKQPLGKYYLYFAHHDGNYIRLAYADRLDGPWTTFSQGVLPLESSHFAGHLASPDVIVDRDKKEIRLYYHGSETVTAAGGEQTTRLATSSDGLTFRANPEQLGGAYFRVFRWREHWYALAMPGQLYRSADGISSFERGPALEFARNMRHSAVQVVGNELQVFFSCIGDSPERILFSTVNLTADWQSWSPLRPVTVLEPEYDFEGGNLPRVPSRLGRARTPVWQLRDPAIFTEDGRNYLLYSVAGESGIGLAEYFFEDSEHDR